MKQRPQITRLGSSCTAAGVWPLLPPRPAGVALPGMLGLSKCAAACAATTRQRPGSCNSSGALGPLCSMTTVVSRLYSWRCSGLPGPALHASSSRQGTAVLQALCWTPCVCAVLLDDCIVVSPQAAPVTSRKADTRLDSNDSRPGRRDAQMAGDAAVRRKPSKTLSMCTAVLVMTATASG
jgi:hypothetical protein